MNTIKKILLFILNSVPLFGDQTLSEVVALNQYLVMHTLNQIPDKKIIMNQADIMLKPLQLEYELKFDFDEKLTQGTVKLVKKGGEIKWN